MRSSLQFCVLQGDKGSDLRREIERATAAQRPPHGSQRAWSGDRIDPPLPGLHGCLTTLSFLPSLYDI